MTQIKLSIAFILAAATIAPIVAQPIREGHELAGNVGHCPHHHHHHQGVAIPEQSSLEPTSERVLAQEHIALAHDKVLAQEGKVLGHRPVVHSEPEILAREYDEFDGMFERADPEEVESMISKTLPHFNGAMRSSPGPVVFHPNGGPFMPPFGHGPAIRRPFNGLTSPRLPFGHWHGPVVRRPFNGLTSHRPPFDLGRSPVVDRPFNGLTPPSRRLRSGFGLGPAILRLGPARHGAPVVAREYAEFDDMFERDFEDGVEFDARDFDDELYLD